VNDEQLAVMCGTETDVVQLTEMMMMMISEQLVRTGRLELRTLCQQSSNNDT